MADPNLDPFYRELANLIERNRADTRDDLVDIKDQITREIGGLSGQLQHYLLTAVYDAEKAALLLRIGRLEDNETTNRRWRLGLLAAVIAAVVGGVVTVVLTVLLTHGGSHA